MPVVEHLSRGMVEKYLSSAGLRYLQDRDGDFVVQFREDEDWGCSLDVYLTVAGADGDVLDLLGVPNHHVSEARWPEALVTCNQWNLDKRWPKAAFRTGSPNAKSGMFVLQAALDLEKGIHQEFLDNYIYVFMGGVSSFLQWAHESRGF